MKTMKWAILGLIIIALGVWLSGCTRKNKGQIMDGDGMMNSYRQITQEEAKEMMKKDDGHVIVDVRRQD